MRRTKCRGRFPSAVLGILVGATSLPAAAAAEPAELRALFPHEAVVVVERDGLSRLVLPADVLAECRADLSDLRLFDGRDRETPFLVDVGAPDSESEATRRFDPALLQAARQEVRRETSPPLRQETYEIELPAAPPLAGHWTLVLDVPHAEFVARVRVEEIRGIDTGNLLVDGSVFRLGRAPRAEKLRLPLPAFFGDRLRVALESEHRTWLDPKFHLESARTLERGGHIAVPLEISSTHRDNDKTIVTLVRPSGIVPDVLRVDTGTGTFDRAIEVWDEGSGRGGGVVGRGKVFRVDAVVPVAERDIRLQPVTGDQLRVEIDDGDSPPLENLRFEAVVRQPALVFAVPDGQPATLRFGGGRAHRPRYDLVGLLPPGHAAGKRARAAAALYDRTTLGTAVLGPIRPNPWFDRAPALAFAMRPGAEIDRRVFRHVRPVRVPDAPEGLSFVDLPPEDLALLNADLGDVRIAGADSRQWPYLIERVATDRSVALAVAGPRTEDGASRYALELPVSPLAIERLVLYADAPYFDRTFRLVGVAEGGEPRTLASGRLQRPIDDPRPVAIDVDAGRLESLALIVEDGDDAPLTLRAVVGRLHVPRLYLTAPEGEYDLLLGAPDETAPQYELQRVRDVVLAVQAAAVETGDLRDNPDFSRGARLRGRETGQRVLLWAALIVAVAFLAFMTLRLARK